MVIFQWAREIGQKSKPKVRVPLHSCEHYHILTKPIEEIDRLMPGKHPILEDDKSKTSNIEPLSIFRVSVLLHYPMEEVECLKPGVKGRSATDFYMYILKLGVYSAYFNERQSGHGGLK